MPPNVARRVVAYVEHEWRKRRGVDERLFDRELPVTLRQACARVRAAALLRKLPALSMDVANETIVNALSLKLDARTYALLIFWTTTTPRPGTTSPSTATPWRGA